MTIVSSAVDSAGKHLLPLLLTKSRIRKHYLPVGQRTLDRWIAQGTFPRPDIAIGGKARYWRRETVEGWIAKQIEGCRE